MNPAAITPFPVERIRPSSVAVPAANALSTYLLKPALAGFLAVTAFYLSLVATSAPLVFDEHVTLHRAIGVLEAKGFEREAFLLKNVTTFRSSDHWLNVTAAGENAYAATNFPFAIVTLYPDFYSKAVDDTERAMVLLHEAQHMLGKNEAEAYSYVWTNRHRLGWTALTHGTTPTFVTVELQTREFAPQLFTCTAKAWNDCTETLFAKR